MITLLIATRNNHKVREIGQILGSGFHCLKLSDLPAMPEVVEDAETFAGNAAKKALALAGWLLANPEPLSEMKLAGGRLHIVADDSGLEVDALGGAPGVHSARFAADDPRGSGNSPDAANNAKLLRVLESVPKSKRSARFRCVLALIGLSFSSESRCVAPIGPEQIVLFDGVCEGSINDGTRQGQGGFGYDPLFVPDGFDQSFAELGEDAKNKLSHRGRAMEKLRQYFAAINLAAGLRPGE